MVAFLIALLPSVGALFIFWIGIKALIEADRRERAAQARFEARRGPDNGAASHAVPLSGNSGPVTGGEEASSAPLPPSS